MNTSPTSGEASPNRLALGSLAMAMLLSAMGVSVANVALPTLAESFSAPFHAVQWVVISYLLSVTVLIVGAGRLGDMAGHRRVLTAGMIVYTGGALLCGLAPSLDILIAGRALQGAGGAVLMALTVALVRGTVGGARIGSAMGLLGTMSAIGTAAGPTLGGLLIAGPGWRAIFLAMVPLGLLALYLARKHLPEDSPRAEDATARLRFDGRGTVLLAVTLAAYSLAVTTGDTGLGRSSGVLLTATLIGAMLFVIAERRAAAPLVDPASLRDPALGSALLINLIASAVMMTTLVVGPFYLSQALRLPDALVGIAMSVGPVISALSGVPAGRIVDRFGARKVVIAGLVQMAAGGFALAALPEPFGLAGYLAGIAVLTPGYQLFLAANNTVVMTDVADHRRGVISGMLGLSRNLGLMTGASAMGAVFAAAAGTADLVAAASGSVASGMRATFVLAGCLMLAALVVQLAVRSRDRLSGEVS